MRADMTPEEVRAAGVYLNGGRRRGWKRRLSALLDTPEATVAAWSTRSRGNARPISGAATVAIKLLVAMMRQELMTTAHPGQARDALAERLAILLQRPDPLRPERPITIEGPGLPAAQPMPAPAGRPAASPHLEPLGIQGARPPDIALPFRPRGGRGGSRSGQPGGPA